jgi:hypothetical protein
LYNTAASRTVYTAVLTLKYSLLRLRVFENIGLRVFENRVLREILGPEKEEVTEEWRILHTGELNDLYS